MLAALIRKPGSIISLFSYPKRWALQADDEGQDLCCPFLFICSLLLAGNTKSSLWCSGDLWGSRIPTPPVPFYPLFLRLSYVLPCERAHSPSSLPGRDFQGAGWMFLCLFVCRKKWFWVLLVRRSIQAEMQHSPPKKEFKILLALYGGLIVQAVSVVACDSEYMVLQDQESA